VCDIAQHMLEIYTGKAQWRELSDPKLLAKNDPSLFFRAMSFKSVGNEEFSDHRQPLLNAMSG
jgi:hypothetical protein